MIPMESINNSIFKFSSSQKGVKHPRFADYLFDTNDFILNGGVLIWTFVIYLILSIVISIL
jgi:hypothetical protein